MQRRSKRWVGVDTGRASPCRPPRSTPFAHSVSTYLCSDLNFPKIVTTCSCITISRTTTTSPKRETQSPLSHCPPVWTLPVFASCRFSTSDMLEPFPASGRLGLTTGPALANKVRRVLVLGQIISLPARTFQALLWRLGKRMMRRTCGRV